MAEFQAKTDKRVAVFVAPGLEEIEALAPYDVLYRAGIPAELISVSQSREVLGSHEILVTCSRTLEQTDLEEFDMLFLPGGIPGTMNLKAQEGVTSAVTERMRAGRPVAAICAAPSILAELGLLEGRRATANPGFMKILEDNGAVTSEDTVVRDGNLLTSRGMATSVDLGIEMVRFYLGDEGAEAVSRSVVHQ